MEINKHYMLVLPRGEETFPVLPDWTPGVKTASSEEPFVLHNRQVYKVIGKISFSFNMVGWRLADSNGRCWVMPMSESTDAMFRLVNLRR